MHIELLIYTTYCESAHHPALIYFSLHGGAVPLFISNTNLRFFSVVCINQSCCFSFSLHGGGCSIVRNNQSYCLSFCQPPAWEGCSVDYKTCGFVFGYCELQSQQISALLTVYKPIVGYSPVHIFTQVLLNEELNSSFIYVHHVRVRILRQSTILFCLFTTSINRRGFFQIRTTRFPSEMEA